MKLLIFLGAVCLVALPGAARSQDQVHKGFYLSVQIGSVQGSISGMDNQQNTARIEGQAVGLDIMIGAVVWKDLVLYGVVGMKSITGPAILSMSQPNTRFQASSDYSFDEYMLGAGLMYYLPLNFFVSGVAGSGQFSFTDYSTLTTVSTVYGFSYQLKVGHEWWISSRLALGIALEYAATHTSDESGTYMESWQSDRYGVLLTVTLNGKKRS